MPSAFKPIDVVLSLFRRLLRRLNSKHMARRLSLAARMFRAMVLPVGVLIVLLLATPCVNRGQQRPSLPELLQRFETTTVFWQQFEVAKEIVAAHDISVLPKLQGWLKHEHR